MKAVKKWLPTLAATIKGYLNCNCKNLISTTKINDLEKLAYERDMNPVEDKNAPCKIFCYAALAEEFENTIYSDATGTFLVPYYHGN